MRRFYCPAPYQVGATLELNADVHHHWCRVLRASTSDQAVLFDGSGNQAKVSLTQVSKSSSQVLVHSVERLTRANSFHCHVVLSVSKADRLDWAVQKATELGASSFHLIESERSEGKWPAHKLEKKLEHLQKVAVSACEQSGLNLLPKVHAPVSLAQFMHEFDCTTKLMLAPSDQPINFVQSIDFNHELAILIGPEGGLTDTELKQLQAHNWINWSLGERVLRCETAPLVALSLLIAWSHGKIC